MAMIKLRFLAPRRSLLNPSIFLVALASIFFLPVCQPAAARPLQSASENPLPAEIDRYVDGHQRSLVLRANIEGFAKTVREESSVKGRSSPALLGRLQDLKREYFTIREILFESVFFHASAIVERADGKSLRALLLKTSLSLLAATDLVKNFHMAAAIVAGFAAFRDIWDETDPAHGIPEGSWQLSLEAYHNAYHQDLFREAIGRLKKYQRQLEGYRQEDDQIFLTLYSRGVKEALQEAEQSYALLRAGFAQEDLSQDEKEVRALGERSKTMRADWAPAAPLLREAIARDKGLIRGNVHVRVHAAKRNYLDLREGLYHLAFKHVAKLTRPDIPFPRPFQLRAIAVSFLAAVTLYDNAYALQKHILTIPGVKALLYQGDPALGVPPRFWDNIENEFTRSEYRDLLEAGIQAMEQEQNTPAGTRIEEDPFLAYVTKEVSTSAAIAEIRGEGFLTKIGRGPRSYIEGTRSIGVGILGTGKFQLSRGFGNLVGMIELRKGKLFDQPHWVQFVKERLQPSDLLSEKTPFRITDRFIPGHFGHVARYVGTESQLRDLKLADHKWVSRYRKELGAGRVIVEALRDGTQINTMKRFLNIDDLAILRPKKDKIPQTEVAQAIVLAFSHIGKKYDFDFDNNTWDTIVCSELAFQTYTNVRWPFAKMLSSYTTSPDDVAIFAGSDPSRPFELITFIHDGKVAHDMATNTKNEGLYIRFLGKRYADAVR
jgi:hypothetical protein